MANKKLYYSTDSILSRFRPSLSNYFDVYIEASFDGINNDDDNIINFSAYEAVLPGTSYETTQIFGDRQGVTETFANKRIYPPVDVSFYIDKKYDVLRFFESWMGIISPNQGAVGSSYQKFNYPGNNSSGYKKQVIITKFERDFRSPKNRLEKAGPYRIPPNRCQYILRNAYPTNLISVPVSYEGSSILRTTVTFNYDVYAFFRTKSPEDFGEINAPPRSRPPAQSGGDSQPPNQGAQGETGLQREIREIFRNFGRFGDVVSNFPVPEK